MAKSDYEVQMEELEKEKNAALDNVDKTYSDQIDQTNAFYNSQIDAVRDYKQTQSEIQQAQTDFTIGQIQQQKEETQKDYIKEQSNAYVDFKKQTDPHGVSAEQIAAGGMWGSGYSESAQTAMYNEYQNRVATAKASLDRAVANYNNAITQAQLQNSSVLAEIAYNAFVKETELAMQAFTSRNALLEAQENARSQIESNYLAMLEQLKENNLSGVSDEAVEKWIIYAKKQHPDGVVTDAALWNQLISICDEQTLNAAGLYGVKPAMNAAGLDAVNGKYNYVTNGSTTYGGNSHVDQEIFNAAIEDAINKNKATSTTGTSLEEQLIKLGMSGISPEELMLRIESGEIIMKRHDDGTYTLKKAEAPSKYTYARKLGSEIDPDDLPASSKSALDKLDVSQIKFVR